ncbi:MAG: hypothetical protein AAB255_00395 [Bacteroidota bacterium]
MKLFDLIFSLPELKNQPPVLIDIGASEKINPKWKSIAKYSICVAFDGDTRDFSIDENSNSGFLKKFVFNTLVVENNEPSTKFYLTKNPYCSSTLKPSQDALNVWSFSEKFIIEKEIMLNSTSLSSALAKININYIDWFKSDSQGIDLRIFNSLESRINKNIIVAEFKPGFIDAYFGEDKLYTLLQSMENNNFWISAAEIKGSSRITQCQIDSLTKSKFHQKIISFSQSINPGWIELTYFNSFENISTKRELLLGWVFATIEKQYGFAHKLAEIGFEKYSEDIFLKMKRHSSFKIKYSVLNKNLLNAIILKINNLFSK